MSILTNQNFWVWLYTCRNEYTPGWRFGNRWRLQNDRKVIHRVPQMSKTYFIKFDWLKLPWKSIARIILTITSSHHPLRDGFIGWYPMGDPLCRRNPLCMSYWSLLQLIIPFLMIFFYLIPSDKVPYGIMFDKFSCKSEVVVSRGSNIVS